MRSPSGVARSFLVLAAMLVLFPCSALAIEAQAPAPAPIHQLRVYEIFEPNKQAFHDRFRDHAARIMASHDFKILSIWESRTGERTEFVYLLEWPDEATMKDRWARLMADEEWTAIKARTREAHGRLVGEIQDRVLVATPYSPAL